MHIRDLDTAPREQATDLARVWADVPTWVDAVVDGRPYGTLAALVDRARDLTLDWTDADVDGALAHHPRIGDRPTGADASSAASRREQSSSAGADADTATALREGNAAYEDRFDRVFLIRAAGRTAPEILSELRRRLGNDDEIERTEVAEQLREIAMLRIEASVEDGAAIS
jgi:2-oxo-4-hydroxy-4-carboxy-5-ureidoimidazoline decarboxylase